MPITIRRLAWPGFAAMGLSSQTLPSPKMSSCTQTATTTSSATGPSRSHAAPLPPADPIGNEEDLEEDEEEIL
ncbi:MAG: hypothetical protein NXY57DRAFT_969481 [Lentinula lateritia]|nr:MAG: hypothetical protein NXY57DRAFT_969481 [Lentinula lateritia]